MSFFEPPAAPPEPPPRVPAPWEGPPNNVLGAVVPFDLVVATTAAAVVTVGAATVYPEGFEFEYLVRVRDKRVGEFLPEHQHRWRLRPGEADVLPDELFRFGLEFADGSRVTTLRPSFPFEPDAANLEGPVMMPRPGGGSLERWSGQWWVWPLPPEGSLAFVCEWPVAGITLTRVEVDAAALRDAAGRARVLWENGGSGAAGGSHMSFQAIRTRTKPPPE